MRKKKFNYKHVELVPDFIINKIATAKVDVDKIRNRGRIENDNLFYYFMNKKIMWELTYDEELIPSDLEMKKRILEK